MSSIFFKGSFVVGMTLLSLPIWAAGSMTPDLKTIIPGADGSQFACPGGTTAISTATCIRLPPDLTTIAQTLSVGSTPASGKSNDPSQIGIIVSLSSGNASCPVSAFSMSSDNKRKLLDASKCTASTSTAPPVAVCSTDTTVSTTLLTCALPTSTSVNNPFQKFNDNCPGGGTRAVTGGYDSKTGVLDATITLTYCKDNNGVQLDGTVVIQGTDLIASDGSVAINDTKTINEKVTLRSGKTVTRQCTISRSGTFKSTTHEFNGTIARSNCSLTGSLMMGGLIDFLADDGSVAIEEHEGSSGTSGN
jgi:hypothetical protein